MGLVIDLCGEEPESIVDGPGIRYVIFVQGCPHNCKGCHNPQSHPFSGGYKRTTDEILADIAEDPLISGITLSGGEPFCQAEALCELAAGAKEMGKNVYVYSGWTIEQLIEKSKSEPFVYKLLHTCDVLIDGPYIEEKRSLDLLFRGSSNQRLINLDEYFK